MRAHDIVQRTRRRIGLLVAKQVRRIQPEVKVAGPIVRSVLADDIEPAGLEQGDVAQTIITDDRRARVDTVLRCSLLEYGLLAGGGELCRRRVLGKKPRVTRLQQRIGPDLCIRYAVGIRDIELR